MNSTARRTNETLRDPVAIMSAAALLATVALAAGYIPAARATRVIPVRALRYE
jgi:ABC-type lipoprotein release transport system permease subunit